MVWPLNSERDRILPTRSPHSEDGMFLPPPILKMVCPAILKVVWPYLKENWLSLLIMFCSSVQLLYACWDVCFMVFQMIFLSCREMQVFIDNLLFQPMSSLSGTLSVQSEVSVQPVECYIVLWMYCDYTRTYECSHALLDDKMFMCNSWVKNERCLANSSLIADLVIATNETVLCIYVGVRHA